MGKLIVVRDVVSAMVAYEDHKEYLITYDKLATIIDGPIETAVDEKVKSAELKTSLRWNVKDFV